MPKKPPHIGPAGRAPRARQAWDHGGKTRQERGYGAQWERLRKIVLQRDSYLCQPCLHSDPKRVRPAKAVDHIIAKANGGTDDLDNLRAICGPCHALKTIHDAGKNPRLRKRAIGRDGWPLEG
jgi:5-methylcytosine-specific restriction protein A